MVPLIIVVRNGNEKGLSYQNALINNFLFLRNNAAPAERRIVATGEAQTAQRSQRNPWKMIDLFVFAPNGAAEFPDSLAFVGEHGARRSILRATAPR
ncbi:MAG TPA: hypothetical protein PK093_08220 [Phycisphaerae bacterium]|nr:hypothetical protein [Phycisphaerae bacterium]